MHPRRDDALQTIALWSRESRLEVDARCQSDMAGQIGRVWLDISFHKRASNGPVRRSPRCEPRAISPAVHAQRRARTPRLYDSHFTVVVEARTRKVVSTA